MRNSLLLLILFLVNVQLNAQDILGKWRTIDDGTGEAKSVVEIYEKDGKIFGKIVDILTENKDAICKKCNGENKDQPIMGLEIINGLKKDDDVYEGGTILNPENGKVYKCRLKLEEDTDTLQVRGYIAFIYKTQYWERVIE